MKNLLLMMLASTVTFMSHLSHADTIFDTGPMTNEGVANYATYRLMADDFSLSSNFDLTGATLQVMGKGNFSSWDGTAEYYLYSDDGGKPGQVLTHGYGKNINVIDTDLSFYNWGTVKSLAFEFESKIPVNAGSIYWLGMHLSETYESNQWVYDNALWGYSSSIGNTVYSHESNLSEWFDYYPGTLAFSLQGVAAVPEPDTYAMLLCGIGLIGFMVRQRNKRI